LWIFGGIQDTHLQLPRHVVDTLLDLLGPFSSILDDILIKLSLRCEASDLIRLWQATTRQAQSKPSAHHATENSKTQSNKNGG
jgi:hypothetical protein